MKNNKEILEKLGGLVSESPSGWYEKASQRRANAGWLNMSRKIGLKLLTTLRAQGITQKQLAEKLGVTPQQVSKWVKGTENLTLETIGKLENALGTSIVTISERTGSGVLYELVVHKNEASQTHFHWVDSEQGRAAIFAAPSGSEKLA